MQLAKHSKLLILEPDRNTLRLLTDEAESWYDVMATSDLTAYNRWIDDQPTTAVVIADLAMVTADEFKLLAKIRLTRPAARRVVTASLDNLGPIMAGLHAGLIQSVLNRPVNRADVRALVAPAGAASQAEQLRRKAG